MITERNLHFSAHEWSDAKLDTIDKTLEEIEREHITQAVQAEGGRIAPIARRLGISRSTLYAKLKQYNLNRNAAAAGAEGTSPGAEDGRIRLQHETGD